MYKIHFKGIRCFNQNDKARVVLGVMVEDEEVDGDVIASRLKERGYIIDSASLRMFIYYHLQDKYLSKRYDEFSRRNVFRLNNKGIGFLKGVG